MTSVVINVSSYKLILFKTTSKSPEIILLLLIVLVVEIANTIASLPQQPTGTTL